MYDVKQELSMKFCSTNRPQGTNVTQEKEDSMSLQTRTLFSFTFDNEKSLLLNWLF